MEKDVNRADLSTHTSGMRYIDYTLLVSIPKSNASLLFCPAIAAHIWSVRSIGYAKCGALDVLAWEMSLLVTSRWQGGVGKPPGYKASGVRQWST